MQVTWPLGYTGRTGVDRKRIASLMPLVYLRKRMESGKMRRTWMCICVIASKISRFCPFTPRSFQVQNNRIFDIHVTMLAYSLFSVSSNCVFVKQWPLASFLIVIHVLHPALFSISTTVFAIFPCIFVSVYLAVVECKSLHTCRTVRTTALIIATTPASCVAQMFLLGSQITELSNVQVTVSVVRRGMKAFISLQLWYKCYIMPCVNTITAINLIVYIVFTSLELRRSGGKNCLRFFFCLRTM